MKPEIPPVADLDPALVQNLEKNRNRNRIGNQFHFFTSVDSTNDIAKKYAQQGGQAGAVFIAEEQTRGHGRMGRNWLSSPGKGIWMSLLLVPNRHDFALTLLNFVASLAVARTLEKKIPGVPVELKWPNDVLIDKKKVSGILVETSFQNTTLEFIVVGLGINVYHQPNDFPEDLKEKATSLQMVSDRPLSRIELIATFLNEFEPLYDLLQSGKIDTILDDWKDHNHQLGKQIIIYQNSNQMNGVVLDFDEKGGIVIQNRQNEIIHVVSGSLEPQ
jgi:BirA family biotin operon repressor/biotin-[acetyl-CoA-carboxylase] ligase